MMDTLYVAIEINGTQQIIGRIDPAAPGEGSFSYAPEYLSHQDCAPISCHLPLQAEPFDTLSTRTFFEGLLPEGSVKGRVSEFRIITI